MAVTAVRISGAEISAFRSEHELTREGLAALIGVEKKTVCAWEQSRRRPTGTAWKILHILMRGTRGERMLLGALLNTYDVGTPLR